MKTHAEVAQEIDFLGRLTGLSCDYFRHEVIVKATVIPTTTLATALDGFGLVLAPGSTFAYATFQRTASPPFTNGGIKVFDLTTGFPAFVGDGGATLRFADIFYPGAGNVLYVHNQSSNTFQAYDITTRNAPTLLSGAGGFSGGIFTLGTVAYACSNFSDRITNYNITNPAAIVALSSAPADRTDLFATPVIGPTSCWVVGTNEFVVNNSSFAGDKVYFMTVDVTNPAAPAQTNVLQLSAASDPNVEKMDLLISGTTAYVAWSTKLFIVDITLPNAPVLKSTTTVAVNGARGLALNGTTLYIALDSAIAKYDVTNPAAPVLLSSTATASVAFAVQVFGANLGVLDSLDFGAGSGDFIQVLPA